MAGFIARSTAKRNVTVLNKSVKVAERLQLDGACPTKPCISRDGKKILVTEVSKSQVQALEAPCHGQEPFYPKAS